MQEHTVEEVTSASGSPRFVNRVSAHNGPSKVLEFPRVFTKEGQTMMDVFDDVQWVRHDVEIKDFSTGEVVFSQKGVEAPVTWSAQAVQIVASKYFRGHEEEGTRETSVRQLIHRVVVSIGASALSQGWLTEEKANVFEAELTYLLLNQHMAFNSPVWFNVGTTKHPQCSACFILSVEDSMEAILDLAKKEARLFKGGSGAGSNLSVIRPRNALLQGTGKASGPVSFMRGFDAFAGVIKSGGKTRRAAKMVILDAEHPDVMEFIKCKVLEEDKARALIAQGYPSDWNGPAYESLSFQNANNSIRVTDAFMQHAEDNQIGHLLPWTTATRPKQGYVNPKEVDGLTTIHDPKGILMEAASAAWKCGDPGIQFHDNINDMNPVRDIEDIVASNPCSEFMFLNDTACNLASINLLKFLGADGQFEVDQFKAAVRLSIFAQEVLVDMAGYPTWEIAKRSHEYRPLGLGFANLGALLMAMGLAYDSDEGRNIAGAITALMGGMAYRMSGELAFVSEPFPQYPHCTDSFDRVLRKHHAAAVGMSDGGPIWEEAVHAWRGVVDHSGAKGGFRNAQVTVLAPTGTIAFMMDCDTTGIEPDFSLIKYKKLAGGGNLKVVNNTVPMGLRAMGVDDTKVSLAVDMLEQDDLEGFRSFVPEELQAVFDTAVSDSTGRSIHHMGHLKMMEVCQPFLSGAISKTVNMPEGTTVEEIYETYFQAWKMGLKSVAIFRDGSKASQVLTSGKDETNSDTQPLLDQIAELERQVREANGKPARRRLPDERQSITHKFVVGGHEGYITMGMYEDGTPGEVFLTVSKGGSTLNGLLDTVATLMSFCLQYGVPVEHLVEKMRHIRFEPAGFTNNPNIPSAKSIVDYVASWMAQKYNMTLSNRQGAAPILSNKQITPVEPKGKEPTGSPCPVCGSVMIRTGACETCPSCGYAGGCG